MLARRREPARFLLIGTYRPEEALACGRPLNRIVQELHAHKLCIELPLAPLSEAAVADYLAIRFAPSIPVSGDDGNVDLSSLPLHELARVLHRRTEGNPLFLVHLVDDLISQGVLRHINGSWTVQGQVAAIALRAPKSIQQLFARQMERLSAGEQRLLQAASMIGVEFSALVVAAVLESDVVQIEQWCESLVRRHLFLQRSREARQPERRAATRYQFLHTLHRSLWYDGLGTAQRRHLHRRIGKCEEQIYGARARIIATELAVHFAEGRDYERAARYLQMAAELARERYAYQEAIDHLSRGLALLAALPDTPEKAQQELELQTALDSAQQATGRSEMG